MSEVTKLKAEELRGGVNLQRAHLQAEYKAPGGG